MMIRLDDLPDIVYLDDFRGNYFRYINEIYNIFKRDLIEKRPKFGSYDLSLKFNPLFQDKAYTFYHMTHKGENENDRLPDFRRCERIAWAKWAIENVEKRNLKFWRQERKTSNNRICIQLSVENDVDYFVILEVRKEYILIWTAFVAELAHEKLKKEREYQNWLSSVKGKSFTPDSLVKEIRKDMH